ncbi:hypothetical protein [Kitasatospora purpeofusca]|uniref:hypothetical protein n=1 Tax=Kitasatospora purpeofusca TaxID=67352 RepID=UPI003811A705
MDFAVTLLRAALVVAALTAAVTIELLVRSRGRQGTTGGRPLNRWSRAAAAVGGAASILIATVLNDTIDRATGVDDLSMLLTHLCGVVAIVGVQSLLVSWTYPPDARAGALRLRFGGAGVVAAAAVIVFALTSRSGIDLTNFYAHDVGVAEYLLIFDLYWAVTGAAIARNCIPLAIDNARAGQRRIATAQALIAGGGVASGIWGITESAFVAATQFTGTAWDITAQEIISSSSAALFAVFLFSGIAASSIRSTSRRRAPGALRAEAQAGRRP